ncbi:restriction endonuclease subunit S [Rheinheimera tangshanensis]|uniref:Type I restriction modification DNA specificity domain-containing protein n=1 Tax=Rheinheimera tangshanensis TaxID=400153 RepID=A0A5C8LJ46_9GAMM|nr:restriction endonuclease subunit S [Rheinheimera tangshanensis]TXK77396.1 hypothetical protein FU839_18475 [Rheinheimera tangshanensis]GGM72297.1 hypothetical protein GCM10010920_36310 [Rheinheimera tangshanensis]
MVPSGWDVKKIGDVIQLSSGDTKPSDLQINKTELQPFPVYGGNNVMGYSSQNNSDKPIVLIGRVGEYCGITRYIDEPCWITDNALFTKKIDVSINTEYLSLSLKYYDLSRLRNKGGQPLISQKPIYALKISFPPLAEQFKITAILSTWDKAISTTEQLIANSKQQKKALMQQLLTGKKRLLDEKGERFRGEWQIYELGDWIREYSENSVINEQYEVLTSSRGGLVKQSEYFTDSRISQRDNIGFNIIPPGYITFRSRSDDGQFFFNRNEFSFTGIISTYYPVLHFPDGDSTFFLNYLNRSSSAFAGYSVGTSQKVLSLNALKSIKARLPKKEEQQKIASVLTAADQEIEALQNKLEALKQEKKALMQQLLTGKRRVKVDEVAA